LDSTRSHRTRHLRKDQGPARDGRTPSRVVHAVLGAILVAAGALKVYDLLFEARDESTPTLLLIIFSEAELLAGLWMLAGLVPERTYRWAVAGFVGLGTSSLIQALAGKCSCGCFGNLSVSPWLASLFDAAAVAAMYGSRPPRDPEEDLRAQPLRLLGPGVLAVIVGAGGWRQADLVSLDGTAMADNRPLDQATLHFTGDSGSFDVRTDHDGHFRLPLVRPGHYAVSTPQRVGSSKPRPGDHGPGKKKDSRPSVLKSVSPSPPAGAESVVWVEISQCSESRKIVEFQ
jgi:hypothetical protein